jgi:hypothetical protein
MYVNNGQNGPLHLEKSVTVFISHTCVLKNCSMLNDRQEGQIKQLHCSVLPSFLKKKLEAEQEMLNLLGDVVISCEKKVPSTR